MLNINRNSILSVLVALISLYQASAQNTQRNGLAEEFSASSCHPCKDLNDEYHPACVSINVNDTSSHVNAIAYQMDYPGLGDLSYNLHCQQRYDYYNITGLPFLKINGKGIATNLQQSMLYTALDTSRKNPTQFNITGTYEINDNLQTLKIAVNITPLVNLSGKYRVHVAVTERHYTNNATTVNMPEYYNVMRKMFPDGTGTAEYAWTTNTTKSYSFNDFYMVNNPPAQGSFDFWGNPYMTDLIVFVQDSVSKEIIQSQVIKPAPALSIRDIHQLSNIICYPNPAKDHVYIGFNTAKKQVVSMQVTDLTGRSVYTYSTSLNAGTHELYLPTLQLANGAYVLRLSGEQSAMQQLITIAR